MGDDRFKNALHIPGWDSENESESVTSDDSVPDLEQADAPAAASAPVVPVTMGVLAADHTEVAPQSSIELTSTGLISYDGGQPLPYDGSDDYELGLDRLLRTGTLGPWVSSELIPHQRQKAASVIDPWYFTREFFINPALDIWYASNIVGAIYQVYMHPNFSCKSRLYQLRNGFLSIGDLWTSDGPDRVCIGATRKEMEDMVKKANADGKATPIEWLEHPKNIEEVLVLLGFRHYDADAKAEDFLVLLDQTYPDNTSDLLVMKKMPKPEGMAKPDDDKTTPHYFVVGCICAYAGIGIVALPTPGAKRLSNIDDPDELSCPIQCIRFLTSNDDGQLGLGQQRRGQSVAETTIVDKTLFFRAGSRVTDPAMVPYFLCHGRVYERLGRNRAQPLSVTGVEHEFVRVAVYYMHDKFWDDPMWKHAPPQCVLAAKGFKAQLPLVGTTMNREVLRGTVCVLNPRPCHMADVFNMAKCKSRPGSPGTDTTVFLLPSETQDVTFTAPMQTGADTDVHVFATGGYAETVGGQRPNLENQYASWMAKLSPEEIEAASRYDDAHAAPDGMPALYLLDPNVHEVYYKMDRPSPMVVASSFRLGLHPRARRAQVEYLEKLSQECAAFALARQVQSAAEEQAALLEREAAAAAAAKARSDKRDKKKKEKEDYLARLAEDAPGPSSGTPSQEVIEANRIAREERLLALAAAERKQKEADAKAEKEAQRAAKAAQQAENPQLTKQQQVLLNQAAAREKKRLAKAKGAAQGPLPTPARLDMNAIERNVQAQQQQAQQEDVEDVQRALRPVGGGNARGKQRAGGRRRG